MTKYHSVILPDNSRTLMNSSEIVEYAKKILKNNHSVGQHEDIKLSDITNSTEAYKFLSKVGFTPKVNRLFNPSRIDTYALGEEISMPIDTAWEMRAKYAYPASMTPKRPDEVMSRLMHGIAEGNFEPIPVTREELHKGILTEGKHRLIVAKKLHMKKFQF